ncbi:Lysine 2,3-aminomutase (EC [uncultured Gammaproteobacteria bacterium]|jgi:EF-P beta-lysylation protein EpmB|nr:Lysine 2,3-aminomutase (EC 5.4.3.2) [uncultured Gammaproteobacteria bacterium]VVH66834.1 Lysine 2,3-aminomutase (EC [uncultured Gammaproteobacteria bacterium]
MNNNWQHNARNTLKGADNCNAFFQSQQFQDQGFPIKIPLEFASLIDKDNPNDPLLKQVIPSIKPQIETLDFSIEPLKDEENSPVAGLIHKYPNRVLLITSRVCAIHCQYCFRQNFNYIGHDAVSNYLAIEDYIYRHPKINEVILSGGDPLSLSDEKLAQLIKGIENIPHIKNLRIHTRSAVVTPSRITVQLIKLLAQSKLNVVLVTHVNHANELSNDFAEAIQALSGVTLLNQSVLLKGVNDSVSTLSKLSMGLFELGILPYYLHLLDKVSGAEHFLVSDEDARRLHRALQKQLSGYLVPRLVRDENLAAKTWV